ncbi:hypothetical protein AGMMS50268_12940 [Spirochaetia bacterium]|nr:hypothetical protein AGMMS50268_12940 [Spirochaetia bacterium]
MDETVIQKIRFEITQIDREIDEYEPLFALCKLKEPDKIERSAAALLLHSFYNGIEKILILISKNIDLNLPSGNKWHTELFEKSFEKTEIHGNIFREELKDALHNYMSFRHFVRHTYDFQLVWDRYE